MERREILIRGIIAIIKKLDTKKLELLYYFAIGLSSKHHSEK